MELQLRLGSLPVLDIQVKVGLPALVVTRLGCRPELEVDPLLAAMPRLMDDIQGSGEVWHFPHRSPQLWLSKPLTARAIALMSC